MIKMVAAYHRVRPCYVGGTPLYTSNHSFSLMNYVFLCAFTKKSRGLLSNYKLQQLIINGMLLSHMFLFSRALLPIVTNDQIRYIDLAHTKNVSRLNRFGE
mgnify:CR=1 FL=1